MAEMLLGFHGLRFGNGAKFCPETHVLVFFYRLEVEVGVCVLSFTNRLEKVQVFLERWVSFVALFMEQRRLET